MTLYLRATILSTTSVLYFYGILPICAEYYLIIGTDCLDLLCEFHGDHKTVTKLKQIWPP